MDVPCQSSFRFKARALQAEGHRPPGKPFLAKSPPNQSKHQTKRSSSCLLDCLRDRSLFRSKLEVAPGCCMGICQSPHSQLESALAEDPLTHVGGSTSPKRGERCKCRRRSAITQ